MSAVVDLPYSGIRFLRQGYGQVAAAKNVENSMGETLAGRLGSSEHHVVRQW